jgi:hypothetical protein
MRTRTSLAASLLVVLTLCACQDDDVDLVPPGPVPPLTAKQALPTGKSDYPLEDGHSYLSPEGFEPPMRIDDIYGGGWVSTHRGADGFDISRAAPGADAPLVVIAYLIPPQPTAEAATRAVLRSARRAGADVYRSTNGEVIQLYGGSGSLVRSRDGGIELDAVPEGYAEISVWEDHGAPHVNVTWWPDLADLDANRHNLPAVRNNET